MIGKLILADDFVIRSEFRRNTRVERSTSEVLSRVLICRVSRQRHRWTAKNWVAQPDVRRCWCVRSPRRCPVKLHTWRQEKKAMD